MIQGVSRQPGKLTRRGGAAAQFVQQALKPLELRCLAAAPALLGVYREAEDAQFHCLWRRLPDGCICLLDRHFASFRNLAKLAQRGVPPWVS